MAPRNNSRRIARTSIARNARRRAPFCGRAAAALHGGGRGRRIPTQPERGVWSPSPSSRKDEAGSPNLESYSQSHQAVKRAEDRNSFPIRCLIQYSLLGATRLRCGGLQFHCQQLGIADVHVISDIFACEIPVAMEDRREPLKDLDA